MYYFNKLQKFESTIMKRWFFTTNHKRIGIMYMIFGVFNGFLSILLSGLMRLELLSPGTNIFFGNDQFYNAITSMLGALMLFAVVMPILFGINKLYNLVYNSSGSYELRGSCFYRVRPAYSVRRSYTTSTFRGHSARKKSTSSSMVFSSDIDSENKVFQLVRDYVYSEELFLFGGLVYFQVPGSLNTFKVDCKIEDLESRIVKRYTNHYIILSRHLSSGLSFISRNAVLDNFSMRFDFVEYNDFALCGGGALFSKCLLDELDMPVCFHFFNCSSSDLLGQSLSIYISLILGRRKLDLSWFEYSADADLKKVYTFFKTIGKLIAEYNSFRGGELYLYGLANSGQSYLMELVLRTLFAANFVGTVESSIKFDSKVVIVDGFDGNLTHLGYNNLGFGLLDNNVSYCSRSKCYSEAGEFVKFTTSLDSLGFNYLEFERNLPLLVYAAAMAAKTKHLDDWVEEVAPTEYVSLHRHISFSTGYNKTARRHYSTLSKKRSLFKVTILSYGTLKGATFIFKSYLPKLKSKGHV